MQGIGVGRVMVRLATLVTRSAGFAIFAPMSVGKFNLRRYCRGLDLQPIFIMFGIFLRVYG